MAERFVVIPAHLAQGATFDDFDAAVASAVSKTDKDRAPRMVLQFVDAVVPNNAPRAAVAPLKAVVNG